ncbi:MAG: hypothetical protein V4559_00045 [Pseudomonadota bacterium]
MKGFSFHIEPAARFEESGKRIRRSRLDLALQFRLPALKRATPKVKAAPRKVPAKSFSSDREILAAHQARYGIFVISTMQRRDGRWFASFGCADGRLLTVDGRKQAVSITDLYPAEVFALAEAQVRIDALNLS